MKTTLIIMAAGIGSRYGAGIKQLAKVGPSGELIIDYSVHDALEAGFDDVTFIIRKDIEADFREVIGNRIEKLCPCTYVFQDVNNLPGGFVNPEGRTKPWGTGHAVLTCKGVVNNPALVINADDYYGKESFKILADWLRANEGKTGEYALVGFELDNTLSESGGVSRGIGTADQTGYLTDVVEHHKIAKAEDGKIYGENNVTGEIVELAPKSLCSMNMWGFTPDYFTKSEEIFTSFLEKNINELKAEFYIPFVIDSIIKDRTGKCELLSTPSRWFGVTFQEDRPGVVAKFQEFADNGIYPTPLYK